MFWFSVCYILMVDCFVAQSDFRSLRPARILLGIPRSLSVLTVNYFVKGRGGVNVFLVFERWLKAGERYANSGSNSPKRVRKASIKYETARICDGFSGEHFQNIETFMVVRSSVFPKCSTHKTHLARDAYHAYWDPA